MVFQPSEKEAGGKLLGLILLWNCAQCETGNITWLIHKEAASGEKSAFCTYCKEKTFVKFVSSDIMSEREKMLQQALSFIPLDGQKEVLQDLAWTEALFTEGFEKFAAGYWQTLLCEVNLWVQLDQYKVKK